MPLVSDTIPHRRLYHQHISFQKFNVPGELVAWLGAMQAQDYINAKWAIGLRLPDSRDSLIEQAISDHTILRSWILRGTLHFVAVADIDWMLRLLAPRLIAGNARRYRELELDEQTLIRSNSLLYSALIGGRHLTRHQLFNVLDSNGISTEGQRGVYMLQRASLDRLICQDGAVMRSISTFIALDDLNAAMNDFSGEEALAELARRYFTSHGPSTLQDFIWWSGLTTAEAKRGLEGAKPMLDQETIGEQTYWYRGLPPTEMKPSPDVYLLPGFDEYLLGYRDRDDVLEPQYKTKVVPGGNGIFNPMIVVDGRIVGTWKRTLKKSSVSITAQPFTALSPAEMEGFAAAAQGYADFLGLTLDLL